MNNSFFVDVILPLPLQDLYTYALRPDMHERVKPGMRVVVQFGKQKIYAGIVARIHENQPAGYEIKEVLDILDDRAVIDEPQFRLWQWISDYYLCSMGDVMTAALPAALKLQSESKIIRHEEFDGNTDQLTDREYLVWEALEMQPELSVSEISKILSLKHIMPVLKGMVLKQVIRVREEMEERVKPRLVDLVRLTEKYQTETALTGFLDTLGVRAAKQSDLILAFLHLSREEEADGMNKQLLLKKSGVKLSVLQALVKKGVFEIFQRRVDRIGHYNGPVVPPLVLNNWQEQAILQIREGLDEHKVVLLHGVTSSGKTEVYAHLIDEELRQGKQVLYLLPEIALTTQLISRMQKHFGDRMLVYHSRFNEQERVEVWNKVLQDNDQPDSKGKLIIGARSALFIPFANLGLVIVDEEHDHSFKQEDPAPRYHARDAAVVLAAQQDAKIILGTATPALETYFNALSGKYHLVTLEKRHAGLEMPEVKLVDMKEARKRKQANGHFSNQLLEEVQLALDKNQQIILFQNRRGFAPYLECNVCSWTPLCVNCDVALTYHKYRNELRCHYCGYTTTLPSRCGACGDQDIRMKGFGTERIEEDLQLIFPNAVIGRLDLDTTRTKSGFQQIISRFEEGDIDILVGTQMVTKGLDFDKVRLVGILNADAILHFPEFRAHERGFQLLAQVSGRAGRKAPGKVLIQAYEKNNPVLAYVLKHDYKGFYMHELNERYKFSYPPYFRLIEIRLKARDEKELDRMAAELSKELRKMFAKRVLGPTVPYVNRVRNLYQRHLILKIEKTMSVAQVKKQLTKALFAFRTKPENRQLILQLDVDPV
ncbi:MAG: primosomal protein N' [Bacteroidia bacterium]